MNATLVDTGRGGHDDKLRVVWVLGAGFSRPLGAPLLFDFFRPELHERLKARYKSRLHWRDFDRNLNVLSRAYFGLNVPDVQPPAKEPQGAPWRNAEEFIEYVELASHGNDRVAQAVIEASYRRANTSDGVAAHMDTLAKVAKKYLALSCWEFSDGADCATERWAPYRAWAAQLDPAADAVIAFNYDTVCEQVVRHLGEHARPSAFAKPWTISREGEPHSEGCDRYLKLHGSSSWYTAPEQASNALCFPMFGEQTPPTLFLDSPDPSPAIAIPGPDKVGLADRLFRRHWERAEELLREATVIVFVGYRFPESDNEAKRRLLAAIGQNGSDTLSVHIVLGPKRDDDVIRLESLINWSLLRRPRLSSQQAEKWQKKDLRKGFKSAVLGVTPPDEIESWRGKKLACVSHQPLWAQDFLGVFQRESLDLLAPVSPL